MDYVESLKDEVSEVYISLEKSIQDILNFVNGIKGNGNQNI